MPTTTVTCPECGTTALITDGRRDASDFCAACDFPLFWSRTTTEVRGDLVDTDDALRRLPGTDGRGLAYSVPCPTCGELNLATARTCLRCTGSMVPPPPPVPVPLPQPQPVVVVEPEPEPETTPWWLWWAVAGTVVLVTTAVAVYVTLR
ncbi:hypothetical protein SANBI_002617 [Sanguibacter sp. 4.1]|uniref:Uncharacterized protein n=1 Tax=Sanguibacter biliveldensis TaxID=3030830 RepID=A0AAF0Z739_9MICO|nr:hypothetical protein [Sanguibacter sp. 4.1]WPF81328.1 hypothetical protein SANBI_002617 [Sanguibacter sp. 4.1]